MLAVLTLLAGVVAAPAPATPIPAPRAPLDQSVLLSQVVPGLVDINTTLSYQGAVGAGTGILLSPDGEVLTNNHVIEGATDITAVSLANSRTYPVDVIGFDRASDIALVRLRGATGLPTAILGTSSTLAVGDPIAAIGAYWAQARRPTDDEVRKLEVMARVTATALDGAQVYASLSEALERRNFLLRELDHRCKNMLAAVQAIADQTLLLG